MNEVVIKTHTGDSLRKIIDTALEIVKIKTVSYIVFTFNECTIFVKKDSDISSVISDYQIKMKSIHGGN